MVIATDRIAPGIVREKKMRASGMIGGGSARLNTAKPHEGNHIFRSEPAVTSVAYSITRQNTSVTPSSNRMWMRF